jgi:hypothetical protein
VEIIDNAACVCPSGNPTPRITRRPERLQVDDILRVGGRVHALVMAQRKVAAARARYPDAQGCRRKERRHRVERITVKSRHLQRREGGPHLCRNAERRHNAGIEMREAPPD